MLLRITLEGGLKSLTTQNEGRRASEKAREWHPEDKGRKQASPWRDVVPKTEGKMEKLEKMKAVHLTASVSSVNCKGHEQWAGSHLEKRGGEFARGRGSTTKQ